MQVFYDSMSVAIAISVKRIIPRGKFRRGKKMGWNEKMELKRGASKDYYLWKAAGKPRQSDMYETMLKSRKLFKSKSSELEATGKREIW